MPREWVFLECGECGTRYYRTTKNPKAQNQAKLELVKFCPQCRKRVGHKEKKKYPRQGPRAVGQLVDYRSPKPRVGSSSLPRPATPTINGARGNAPAPLFRSR